jgi:thymidylate synthase
MPCHAGPVYVADEVMYQLYQRSADIFLVFHSMAKSFLHYWRRWLLQVCDLEAKEVIWTGGDTHITTIWNK